MLKCLNARKVRDDVSVPTAKIFVHESILNLKTLESIFSESMAMRDEPNAGLMVDPYGDPTTQRTAICAGIRNPSASGAGIKITKSDQKS